MGGNTCEDEIGSRRRGSPAAGAGSEPGCFAYTDLYRVLIGIGLIAHTCVEATARFPAELGNEVSILNTTYAEETYS